MRHKHLSGPSWVKLRLIAAVSLGIAVTGLAAVLLFATSGNAYSIPPADRSGDFAFDATALSIQSNAESAAWPENGTVDLQRLFVRQTQLPPTALETAAVDTAPPPGPLRNFRLVGVIIFDGVKLAILREPKSTTSITLYEGDMLDDWRLATIEWNSVTLERRGEIRALLLLDEISDQGADIPLQSQ